MKYFHLELFMKTDKTVLIALNQVKFVCCYLCGLLYRHVVAYKLYLINLICVNCYFIKIM